LNWALLLFLIGIVFIAAWAYNAVRAHNAVKNAEQEIFRMAFNGGNSKDLMNDVRVPESFDELRMARDLQRIAWSPTLIGQYLAKAEIRFTKKQERHVLETWTQLYNAGKEVIQSRTDMARAYVDMARAQKEYQDLNTETQTSAKAARVYMANLDADQAEAQLRKAQAQKARKDLNKKEEPPPMPTLTPEQERILKKAEIQRTIERLQRERDEKLKTISDEDDRMRTQNMYDDEIARWQEKLRRYL